MYLYSLVVVIHSGGDTEIAFCPVEVAESEMPQPHQIVTMDAVLLVHVVFPNLEIRKRNGKIVHLKSVEQMFFTKVDQPVKAAAGFIFTS